MERVRCPHLRIEPGKYPEVLCSDLGASISIKEDGKVQRPVRSPRCHFRDYTFGDCSTVVENIEEIPGGELTDLEGNKMHSQETILFRSRKVTGNNSNDS